MNDTGAGAKTFADFQKAFPSLYSNVRCGFACPPGWTDLVWLLSENLEPHGVHCDQVKEKFGTLRFYLLEGNEAAERLINAAEAVSATICDICGKPGKLGKWSANFVRTMCPEHTPQDVEQDVPAILKGEALVWPEEPKP